MTVLKTQETSSLFLYAKCDLRTISNMEDDFTKTYGFTPTNQNYFCKWGLNLTIGIYKSFQSVGKVDQLKEILSINVMC